MGGGGREGKKGGGGKKGREYGREKRRHIVAYMDKNESAARLEGYGGINAENIKDVSDAGADTFVLGSAIFNTHDYQNTISTLRNNIS